MSEAAPVTGPEGGGAAAARAPAARRNRMRWWASGLAACLVIAGGIYLQRVYPRLAERASLARPADRFVAPGEAYRWGTDHDGREMFSRVFVAAGGTAGVAGIVWLASWAGGALLGMTRFFVPAWVRRPAEIAMRSWFCFPMFVLVAALVSLQGAGNGQGIAVLCVVGAMMAGRRVASTLAETTAHASDFSALAGAIPRWRHWMNFRLPHGCYAGYRGAWAVLPFAILWEASLGFIGAEVAVQPLGLGHLMREGRAFYFDAPWLVLIPGAALGAVVFFARACETAIGARFDRYYSILHDVD